VKELETAAPQAPAPRAGSPVEWLALAGPYLSLLLVVGVFAYLTWERGRLASFLSLSNLRLIVVHASVIGAVAVGMTLIMVSGGIDLSVGYVVSLVTVVTVLVYRLIADPDKGLGAFLSPGIISLAAILAGIATGTLAGLANGLIITRLRIMPFVATLGMMGVARGLAQWLSEGKPVTFPDPVRPPGWVRWLPAIEPEPAWLVLGPSAWTVLLLALAAGVLLRFTVLGRYFYALGSNEATARLCGIRVERTKVIVYTLAGLCVGWAGILQTARSGSGFYNIQAGLELEVIAAVVIAAAA
jgi:ribose/xylose/arabinose/galactoside ABC-type transport system permease subunit